MKTIRTAALILLALLACGLPEAVLPEPTASAPPAPTATGVRFPTAAPPTATAPPASPLPPLPNLDQRPLYWFAPLPPMPTHPGRTFIGSEDFMDLFAPGADWETTAEGLHVFKLYGEWVGSHATDAQLRQAIEAIRARGLALAVEAGPLNPTAACGQGIEGFAGTHEGTRIAQRILAAGGRLDLIALDEPYYFAHFYDGPNACSWTAEEIAGQVDAYIRHMRTFFPDVRIGDTEPMPYPVQADDYSAWLLTFREVAGYDLDFLHLDMDWSRTDWPEMADELEKFGTSIGVPVGIIYFGNHGDPDDEAWLSIAGERVKNYELVHGGTPAHVLFQSWNDKPDHALPESDPNTFTGFILRYFTDQAGLGFTEASGSLAFGKPVRTSAALPGNEGEFAVDRDAGTIWSSGSGPPQWIEIDLGQPFQIERLRLNPSQYPAGSTTHHVYGAGPGTGGQFVLLYTFEGSTVDSQLLEFAPEAPWEEIQFIRIETVSSPSWVAWREIEVFGFP